MTRTSTNGKARKRHTVRVKTQHCTTRLVPGTIKFTIDGDEVGASIPHAHVTNARGYAVPIGAGRCQPVLAQRRDGSPRPPTR
jgi:hypothetical protein